MGSFFSDVLSRDHQVAIYDVDAERLRFTFNVERFTSLDEIKAFEPQLVINAATVKYTLPAFEAVMPALPPTAILSDIASVKTGLPEFTRGADIRSCRHIRCSAPHSRRSAILPTRMPSSSPRATISARLFPRPVQFVAPAYRGIQLRGA